MMFDWVDRKTIESIIRNEELEIRVSETFTNALGDEVFEVKGKKEDMKVLRDFYNMVK
ncbi:hypothetical protein [Allobaculum stercoricanis]|uniref:hypothetical protein n=1 Tax=Allobaculum stercoricanis TaxID=174709 RepID=UPI0029421C88|nr:hypothetical protein [Allobaculum stercoricanis]